MLARACSTDVQKCLPSCMIRASSRQKPYPDKSFVPPRHLAMAQGTLRQDQRESIGQFSNSGSSGEASAAVREVPEHAADRRTMAADVEPGRVTERPTQTLSQFLT